MEIKMTKDEFKCELNKALAGDHNSLFHVVEDHTYNTDVVKYM